MALKIGIIGGGTMGGIIGSSLLAKKITTPNNLIIADKNPSKLLDLKNKCKIITCQNNHDLIKKADFIILATKPQDFSTLAGEITGSLRQNQTIISIMAGVSLKNLKTRLNHEKVVRSMPNLAAKIGQAMTVWMPGFKMTSSEEEKVKQIFQSFGREIKVIQEKYLNMATAVSGSGPGYVFYFIECLIEAAEKLGFSKKQASELVKQTVTGTVELYNASGDDAKTLRQKVCSRQGTTEAALKTFEKENLKLTIQKGIRQALRRARELEN